MVSVKPAKLIWLASVIAMLATMLPSEALCMTTFPAPAFTLSLKVRTRLAPTATLVELSAGFVMDKVGGVVSGELSQPSTSIRLISVGVNAFTTPGLLNAKTESLPALAAQSPKSPLGFVLELSRFLVPLSTEKYPVCVPEKVRTPGAEKWNRFIAS